MATLVSTDLSFSRETHEVIRGVHLTVQAGEVHVLLGRNGSGKTSLLHALMGHPSFRVTRGTVTLDGEDITAMPTYLRARRGMFLAHQQPPAIPGVGLEDLLRAATTAQTGQPPKTLPFSAVVAEQLGRLRLEPRFAGRELNVGASGGEKKRAEIVQLLALAPQIALLDEPDSGLDVAALRYVSDAVALLRSRGTGFLIVSHNPVFLSLLAPSHVHVLRDGALVRSGDATLLAAGIAAVLE